MVSHRETPSLIPRRLAEARRLPPSLSHWEREGGAVLSEVEAPRGLSEGDQRQCFVTLRADCLSVP